MLQYSNGGRLVQSLDELPDLRNLPRLYLDFETTSGDQKLMAVDVWHNCYILGICVGDEKDSWYVPVGHNRGGNLPWKEVYAWLQEIVESAGLWVNHNVKFDMHVYSNNLGVPVKTPVYDTMTQAKIIDSDRLRGYGLDKLSLDWLGRDISHHEKTMAPYLHRNKDYGWIPADVMGDYGCDDIIATRDLYRYIEANRPEECNRVSQLENDVCEVLYHVERSGMNINPQQCQVEQLRVLRRMLEIEATIAAETGADIRPTSDADCYDLLVNMYGLPVIAFTEKREPSFDKYALAAYKQYPGAPVAILDLMLEHRKLATYSGTFLTKYLSHHIDGVLHPSYNQTVRTGRMSCKNPNMQQLMSWAKQLIVPRPGHILVSADYSQIEYRLIVHYIQDPDAIAAYAADPDQDYHTWVANLCQIKRRPAKTVNFLMGYGGGKARLLEALSNDPDLVGQIAADSPAEFKRQANALAESVYYTYHNKLPSLRTTSRQAELLCRQRGYIRNMYGRRRHLPSDFARKAFNTANQSSAADMMKERMVAVHRAGFELIGSVHDELVITMPVDEWNDDRKIELARILESPEPNVKLRVPIRCSVGASLKSWYDASESSEPVSYT